MDVPLSDTNHGNAPCLVNYIKRDPVEKKLQSTNTSKANAVNPHTPIK